MDYDIDKITQNDGYVHVFGDASVSPINKMVGVAWLIATRTPEAPIEHLSSEDLPEDEGDYATRLHSTLGEFAAVAIALSNMPENLKIRIHTDNKDVLTLAGYAIRNGEMPTRRIKEAYRPILSLIIESCKKQKDVILEFAQDNKDKEPSSLKRYYMARVHNLAADGSNAQSHIPLPDPYAPDLDPREFRTPYASPLTPHDSSGSMDVIDFGSEDSFEEPFEYGSSPLQKPQP